MQRDRFSQHQRMCKEGQKREEYCGWLWWIYIFTLLSIKHCCKMLDQIRDQTNEKYIDISFTRDGIWPRFCLHYLKTEGTEEELPTRFEKNCKFDWKRKIQKLEEMILTSPSIFNTSIAIPKTYGRRTPYSCSSIILPARRLATADSVKRSRKTVAAMSALEARVSLVFAIATQTSSRAQRCKEWLHRVRFSCALLLRFRLGYWFGDFC